MLETVFPERFRHFDGLDGDWGNPDFAHAGRRILVSRLSSFADTDRSTSHLFLFSAARRALPGAFIDFSFMPDRAERKALKASGLPLLRGWASGRPAAAFDLILISNSFALELLNLLPLISSSGIPSSFAERSRTSSPILLLGGSNAFCTHALWEDPFEGKGDALVDAVYFGEGELQVPAMLRSFDQATATCPHEAGTAMRRAFILDAMAKAAPALSVPGIRPNAVQAVLPLSADECVDSWETSVPRLDGAEATTVRLTISRGCPSFCSFCMEGWERKPWREVPTDLILERAERLRTSSGASTLEVASYNFNAHSDIVRLLAGLGRIFPRVSLMSQRADILYLTEGLLECESAWGKRSFTIGVEGISARMRGFYRKGLDDQVLRGLLESLFRAKAREIKLFFVISGIEEREDLDEFSTFLSWLSDRREALHPGARVIVSSSYLMRMPLTPLEWMPLEFDVERLLGLSRSLERPCVERRIEYRSSSHPDEHCLGQLLVSGCPGLRSLLGRLAERGILYDGSLPRGAWDEARRFLWPDGKIPAQVTAQRDTGQAFPFGFVKRTIDRGWTKRRWEALSSFLEGGKAEAPSCLSASCLSCGACPPDGDERGAILSHRVKAADRKAIEAAATRQRSVSSATRAFVLADIPEGQWRAGREFHCAALARSIIAADPCQAENLVEVEEALFSDPSSRSAYPVFSGRAAFALRAIDPASALAAAIKAGCEPLVLPPRTEPRERLSSYEADLILPGCPFTTAERLFSDFLSACSVSATFSRSSGSSLWSIGSKALKRKILRSARLSAPAGEAVGPVIHIGALPRLDPSPFLKAVSPHCAEGLPRIRFMALDFDLT